MMQLFFQGPLPKTTPDFWRMIWEQHCLVIVMTTRAMERGRPKCHQYWETEAGAEATYGQFVVKTVSVETDTDYTVTTISINNKKVSMNLLKFSYKLLLLVVV